MHQSVNFFFQSQCKYNFYVVKRLFAHNITITFHLCHLKTDSDGFFTIRSTLYSNIKYILQYPRTM